MRVLFAGSKFAQLRLKGLVDGIPLKMPFATPKLVFSKAGADDLSEPVFESVDASCKQVFNEGFQVNIDMQLCRAAGIAGYDQSPAIKPISKGAKARVKIAGLFIGYVFHVRFFLIEFFWNTMKKAFELH